MMRSFNKLVRHSVQGYSKAITTQSCKLTMISRAAASRKLIGNHRQETKRSLSTATETLEFQAETRKLLDIVTNSIYTDKEVFIRELVSNASDALEKYRYKQVNGEVTSEASSLPLEINIITDQEKKTLTIVDNGIGMTRSELVSNLGTIARSGSKQFVEELKTKGTGSRDGDGIIGQFGVGFYSSFMVSNSVTVQSRSASTAAATAGEGHQVNTWKSDGSGLFTIESLDSSQVDQNQVQVPHGSAITMHLKDTCAEFADAERIKTIIKKYSNFVAFPIKLNGEIVNTVSAIWMEDKKTVTEAQYDDFYKFIASAYDKPKFTLHFRTDAPLDIKCLLYVPSFHSEKFGMGRMETGVNLYSRKVLIESKPKDLLPDWLRFVKGVVDSEDLPLSLSREKPQDSNLLKRIREVLTRKMIRFLEEQAKDHPVKYKEFYIEYNYFLKEGICHDHKFLEPISKLLLFESSAKDEGELTSLDDYISRCTPEQKKIYYLVAPSRDAALRSPYYETFKKHKQEVLLMYNTIDDFVMSNVKSFGGRELTSAETSQVDLDKDDKPDAGEKKEGEEDASKKDSESAQEAAGQTDATGKVVKLSQVQAVDLCMWLKTTLGSKRVKDVRMTNRLSDSPAIVTDHESGALRRMLKMVDQANGGKSHDLPPQVLEINPSHPIIVNLFLAKDSASSVTQLVSEQMLDNCLIAAGLIDDPRMMLPRLNDILAATLAAGKQ